MDDKPTITSAASAYLDSVSLARSANTARTYRNALQAFSFALLQHKIDPETAPVSALPEDAIVWLTVSLKENAPTTERLYITAVKGFYEYLAAENLASINLPRIQLLIRQRARRPGIRLPQFPEDEIEKVLEHAEGLIQHPSENEQDHLRNLRDRAFLLTLADTGLRVHEACNLRRGDLDWNNGRAIIIGKGNKQAVVRFSKRAQNAIHDYLGARAVLDGKSGRALSSLPLFARHDRGGINKTKPMTTTTGRNIVTERVREKLGEDAVGRITPHSFRHYFVTQILHVSGNLKLAQELARHQSIAITQRYAHLSNEELDKGYREIFEEN